MILNYPSPKTRNQLALNEEEIRQLNDRFRDGNTATLKRFNLSQDLFFKQPKTSDKGLGELFSISQTEEEFFQKMLLTFGNWKLDKIVRLNNLKNSDMAMRNGKGI